MDSASVKQAIIRQVQTESNVANSRELFEACAFQSPQPAPTQPPKILSLFSIQKVNEHCFEKCVPKPGSSLSSGETSCVTMCMDKYLAAWNKVNASLLQRMQQENKAAGN